MTTNSRTSPGYAELIITPFYYGLKLAKSQKFGKFYFPNKKPPLPRKGGKELITFHHGSKKRLAFIKSILSLSHLSLRVLFLLLLPKQSLSSLIISFQRLLRKNFYVRILAMTVLSIFLNQNKQLLHWKDCLSGLSFWHGYDKQL